MGSLQLGTAFNLLVKTMPILLVRLGVSLVFWLVLFVYWAIVLGLFVLLSKLSEVIGLIFILFALGGTYTIFHLAKRYVFFLIKAAHLAVVAELLQNGKLPEGQSQLAWGRAQVTQRFGEVSVMFVVDELVNGVIATFTRMVSSIASWIPGDTMRQLVAVVNRIIRYATSYIDEAVLARAFWRRDENLWESAKDGVVLYGMVWKPLLKNAVALMVLSYVPFILALIIFAAPVGFLVSLISSQAAAISVILLLILAFLIKVAVGDSFAMVAMVAAYQRETAQLTPDPAMEARLEQVSDKFRDLKSRIAPPPPAQQVPLPAR